ncbi:MAG TPA: M48 family metallopeptidase [Verrucomicrobiae bacterium]|jgi:STE24 endopeptidase|nr:M48 family metallopeptidase [Verrucomicrobiae bacterium]
MTAFAAICLALILAKWIAQLALEGMNQRHVQAHAKHIPGALRDVMSPENYAKSVDYTLAKARFEKIELTWQTLILTLALFTGVLPWFYAKFPAHSLWAGAGFIFATGILLSLPELPLEWHEQFHLEERFGFNTTTPALWWMDRLKGMVLSLVIGLPLLTLILKLVDWMGAWWWFWAWLCVTVFQLVMMVLAPILIMPLFNKFTPLPEGPLRERLLALGQRAGFSAKDIQVMDGSKRSRHSNAFFTGFGSFRKIVIFDTLAQQLENAELEAVLAHEIGHYKKRHIPKMLAASMAATLLGFYAISVLARQAWFYHDFGFAPGSIVPAFLLFGLLAGTVTFWLSPLTHSFSRRYEYEADAYAAALIKATQPLVGALRKLNEKNLSNLTPHPIYSGFYYSHPTLLEREAALAEQKIA